MVSDSFPLLVEFWLPLLSNTSIQTIFFIFLCGAIDKAAHEHTNTLPLLLLLYSIHKHTLVLFSNVIIKYNISLALVAVAAGLLRLAWHAIK